MIKIEELSLICEEARIELDRRGRDYTDAVVLVSLPAFRYFRNNMSWPFTQYDVIDFQGVKISWTPLLRSAASNGYCITYIQRAADTSKLSWR